MPGVPEHHPQRRAPLLVLHRGGRAAGGELSERSRRRFARSSRRAVAAHAARDPRGASGRLRRRAELRRIADIDARDARARDACISGSRTTDGAVVSTLRLLDEGDGTHRIGRVATAPSSRGRGYSSALMRRAIELSGPPIVLSAQAYLVDWYARLRVRGMRRALDRGRHRARADAPRTSAGDDVDDAVDDRDHRARGAPGEQFDDPRMRERERPSTLCLGCPRIDIELGATLAVHRDRDRRSLRSGQLGVVGGPRPALMHGGRRARCGPTAPR